MKLIKKVGNGSYYVFQTYRYRNERYRNWFLVKQYTEDVGGIPMQRIRTPTELIGKKIRFKVEIC